MFGDLISTLSRIYFSSTYFILTKMLLYLFHWAVVRVLSCLPYTLSATGIKHRYGK